MPHLPNRFAGIILSFAPLFVHRLCRKLKLYSPVRSHRDQGRQRID